MFKRYIADRKFYRELFIIIVPIVFQFFIQTFINFLDNLMVGRIEGTAEQAIAGVSIANQYYKLFYPTIVSICTGAAVFTAQYYGSKKYKELQKVFGIKLIFPFIVTIIFVVIGFSFTKEIVSIFKDKDQEMNPLTLQYGVEYLKIALWSYIPLSISTAFTFTFRPLNLSVFPMIASSVGLITNTILNYFLIYGVWIFPELGVKGAAIGTVVARVLELLVYLFVYLRREFPFKTKIGNYFKIDPKLIKNTFRKVFPLFINEFTFSYASILIFYVYSQLGSSAINVVSISDTISQIVFILASGLGTATSILVGQKLGNDDLERAEKNADYLLGYSVMMGFVIFVLLSMIAFIVPQFYNVPREIKLLTSYAIIIQGAVAPILMLTRIPFFVLRTGGRVIEVLLLDSLFMWVVKVPVAFICGYLFNFSIIYLFLAVELTRVLNAVISMHYYNQRKWLKNLTKE